VSTPLRATFEHFIRVVTSISLQKKTQSKSRRSIRHQLIFKNPKKSTKTKAE
jgi:hypothetical protein